jgi:hypothetical protein
MVLMNYEHNTITTYLNTLDIIRRLCSVLELNVPDRARRFAWKRKTTSFRNVVF